MELHALALEFGVAVFFAEVLDLLAKEILIHGTDLLANEHELAVHDLTLLHTVVAENVDGVALHLVVDAARAAGAHHQELVRFVQTVKDRAVFGGHGGAVLGQCAVQIKADQSFHENAFRQWNE